MEQQLKTSPTMSECFLKKGLFAVESTLIEQIQVALCVLMVFYLYFIHLFPFKPF